MNSQAYPPKMDAREEFEGEIPIGFDIFFGATMRKH